MASDFSRASAEMLDKQYGGSHSVNTDDSHIQWFRNNPTFPYSDIAMSYGSYRPMKGYEEDWPSWADKEVYNGDKEISDFVKGKNHYIKGKGWQ